MTDIPYNELFQYIHPLNKKLKIKKALQDFHIPFDFNISLKNHYGFILNENYITEEKIQLALKFLNDNYQQDNIVEKAIEFIKTPQRQYNNQVRELDFKEVSYFWVYTVSAFIFLNLYIEKESADLYQKIWHCFDKAETYKELWIDRYGRRKGSTIRKDNYKTIEESMRLVWLTFPETRKNDTQMSCNWLYTNHNPGNIFKESTIKTHIRKWKKQQ